MTEYVVSWRIDWEADSPEQAAREVQERFFNVAASGHGGYVFDVTPHGRDGLTTVVDTGSDD